jgi:predicted flap endonuclease-1-like 5' DNA nuclease
MADVRFLLAQIIAFVVAAAVLGLIVGWLLGRATGRFASIRFNRARDEEFVIVRPDHKLFDENELLRDQQSVLEGKVNWLAQRLSATEAELRSARTDLETAGFERDALRQELAQAQAEELAQAQQEARMALATVVVARTPVENVEISVAEGVDDLRDDALPGADESRARAAEVISVGAHATAMAEPLGEAAPFGTAASRSGTTSTTPPTGTDPEIRGEPLSRLSGINAVHAARLGEAGVHDIDTLVGLDTAGVTRVATETGIPVWRVHLWRVAGRARRKTK